MKTVGFWSHLLFRFLRRALLTCRAALWWFLGYTKLYRRVYEKSARVEKVVWRSKADTFSSIKPWHFLGIHERFAHPSIVLQDDIVLCTVTLDEAVFVQLPSSIKNYNSDRSPFLWITLFESAVRTITMPIQSLIRLAETDERVSTFNMKPMVMSNSGRCGSTLLAKLVQLANSRVLVLSEPDPLQSLHEYTRWFKQRYGEKEFLRIIRCAMLLSFKPVQDMDAIVIKARMTTMRVMKYVFQAAPEIKHVYIQRQDRLKTIQSWERAFGLALEAKIFNVISRLGLVKALVSKSYNAEPDQMRVVAAGIKHLKWTMFETFALLWADNTCAYEYCRKNHGIETIYYEEMTSDPMATLEKTFRILDLHENGTQQNNAIDPKALVGLKGDSQKDTPLSMEAINSRKPTPMTPTLKKRLNDFVKELGLPVFD